MYLILILLRFEPKYLNLLFCLVIMASVINNVCFIALKIVRVHEQKQWKEGNLYINEVTQIMSNNVYS